MMCPSNISEAEFIIRRDLFQYPYSFDFNRHFIDINNLPEYDQFHFFLTNADNEILAIGNPITNPNIRNLFRKIIRGEQPDNSFLNSTSPIIASRPFRNIGLCSPEKPVYTKFAFSNISNDTITIEDIISSCECTTASIENMTIEPRSDCYITIKSVPDSSISGPFAHYVDVYFSGYSIPSRFGINGFIK